MWPFTKTQFDESQYARHIAQRYHTDHHEIRLSADDFLASVPDALAATDHPSGDGPNTYVVSQATKKAGMTVALSGLGGDELFAGLPSLSHAPLTSSANSGPWHGPKASAAQRAAAYRMGQAWVSAATNLPA